MSQGAKTKLPEYWKSQKVVKPMSDKYSKDHGLPKGSDKYRQDLVRSIYPGKYTHYEVLVRFTEYLAGQGTSMDQLLDQVSRYDDKPIKNYRYLLDKGVEDSKVNAASMRSLTRAISMFYYEVYHDVIVGYYRDIGYEYNGYFGFMNAHHPIYLALTNQIKLTPQTFESVVGPNNIWIGEKYYDILMNNDPSKWRGEIRSLRSKTLRDDQKEYYHPIKPRGWSRDKLIKAINDVVGDRKVTADLITGNEKHSNISLLDILGSTGGKKGGKNLVKLSPDMDYDYVTNPVKGLSNNQLIKYVKDHGVEGFRQYNEGGNKVIIPVDPVVIKELESLARENQGIYKINPNSRTNVTTIINKDNSMGKVYDYIGVLVDDNHAKEVSDTVRNTVRDMADQLEGRLYNVYIDRYGNQVLILPEDLYQYLGGDEDEVIHPYNEELRNYDYLAMIYRKLSNTLAYVDFNAISDIGLTKNQLAPIAKSTYGVDPYLINKLNTKEVYWYLGSLYLERNQLLSETISEFSTSIDMCKNLITSDKVRWIMDWLGRVRPHLDYQLEGNRPLPIPSILIPQVTEFYWKLQNVYKDNELCELGPIIYMSQILSRREDIPSGLTMMSNRERCQYLNRLFNSGVESIQPRLANSDYSILFNYFTDLCKEDNISEYSIKPYHLITAIHILGIDDLLPSMMCLYEDSNLEVISCQDLCRLIGDYIKVLEFKRANNELIPSNLLFKYRKFLRLSWLINHSCLIPEYYRDAFFELWRLAERDGMEFAELLGANKIGYVEDNEEVDVSIVAGYMLEVLPLLGSAN